MIAMLVLGYVETFDGAVRSARGNDRDFACKRHESFEDAGLAADVAPCRLRIAGGADRRLAFAVIAIAARLEHGRPADPIERGVKFGRLRNIGERSYRNT